MLGLRGLNSKFYFSHTGCYAYVEALNLRDCLPKTEERIV